MFPRQCPKSNCIAAKTMVLSFLKGRTIDMPNASIFWTTHDIQDPTSHDDPLGRGTVSHFLLRAQFSCLSTGSKQNQKILVMYWVSSAWTLLGQRQEKQQTININKTRRLVFTNDASTLKMLLSRQQKGVYSKY